MNRRRFLQVATGAFSGSLAQAHAFAERGESAMGVKWKIGCFNRPWSAWSYDVALDGMKEAGYHEIGILGDHKGEPFIYPEATPEYLESLKKRIVARGLKVILGRMHIRFDVPVAEAIATVRKQIENAHTLKLKYLMAIGADKPAEFDCFYQVMADAAAYAKPYGIQVIFKPHGGCAAAADEIQRCIDKVNHPNFRLWYDAGNIIHYTGKDPIAEGRRVAQYATGFCAKDCAKQGGDVMLQFGTGKVDFEGVFRTLKEGGFKGPILVECCAGKTPEEVTANARANRLYLEKILSAL